MDENIDIGTWVRDVAGFLESSDSAVGATLTTVIGGRVVDIKVTVRS